MFGDDLSANKARILLMLALQSTSDAKQLQKIFDGTEKAPAAVAQAEVRR